MTSLHQLGDLAGTGSSAANPEYALQAAAPGGGRTATFEISRQLRDADWDDYLGSIPGVHFEQTSGWAAVKSRYGWKVFRILVKSHGAIVGGVQVLTRRFGVLGAIGYVARGPVAGPGFMELPVDLAEQVNRLARRERWLYCVFNYPYQAYSLAHAMAADDYGPHPAGIPPSGLLSATSLIDLQQNEIDIFNRIYRKARRAIRVSQCGDLDFIEGGSEDLSLFRELMIATCRRRGAAPTPPQSDYFHHLWGELEPRKWVKLFLVRCDGEIVSAVFAFTLGDTIRLWKCGWSGRYTNKHPNHFLYWQVIRWAKANAFKWLDFVSVDPEDARHAAQGELSKDRFRDGCTYFKLSFGGTLHFTPPVQSCSFNPLFRFMVRCGVARLLTRGTFQRALSRCWSVASG